MSVNVPLVLIVLYGPVLGVIYRRVQKRTHPSRNVLINLVVLSACLAMGLAVELDLMTLIDAHFHLDNDKLSIKIWVTVMILSWVGLWRWLMRRFERPKSRPRPVVSRTTEQGRLTVLPRLANVYNKYGRYF